MCEHLLKKNVLFGHAYEFPNQPILKSYNLCHKKLYEIKSFSQNIHSNHSLELFFQNQYKYYLSKRNCKCILFVHLLISRRFQ